MQHAIDAFVGGDQPARHAPDERGRRKRLGGEAADDLDPTKIVIGGGP